MRVGAGSAANEEGGLHFAKPQGPMVRGSPAYQSELTKDAMAVVLQKGPPTYFTTMTANAKCPEIEALTTPPSRVIITKI